MSDQEDYDSENSGNSGNSFNYSAGSKKNIPIKIKPLKGGSVDEFSDDDDDDDMDNIDKSINELEPENEVANDEDIDYLNEDVADEDNNDTEDENDLDDEDNDNKIINSSSNINKISDFSNTNVIGNEDTDYSDNDDDEDTNDNYLQKFNSEITKNYVDSFHPECLSTNLDEVDKLSRVVRDKNNIIIDPLHKTIPFMTKYEKARIIGQRCAQLDHGSTPFVKVPEDVIESYIIAGMELQEKKIPFIIKRPIPNGGFEYWNVRDLEILSY